MPDAPPDPTALRRLGGWSGVVAPVVYVATWAVLGALRPGYDPVRQAISELGEQGAATAPAMSAAFAAFGLLGLPFAIALDRLLPGRTRAAAVAAATCALATVGAAAFPCSPGCPGPAATATDLGHGIVAVVGYLALAATPALVGQGVRHVPGWTGVARWSLAAAAVGGVLMATWALGLAGDATGAIQRTFNTVLDVWWLAAGVLLLRGGPRDGRDGG